MNSSSAGEAKIGAGETGTVSLSYEQRRQHTYVIGVTGTGKTTLLAHLALQDIEAGHGLALLDPHGDLVTSILERLPQARLEDVVLLDPADHEHPFGLNLYDTPSGVYEKDLAASEVVSIFYKLFGEYWGWRMEDIIRNMSLAILDHNMNVPDDQPEQLRTMLDIPGLLLHDEYRRAVLERVKDPVIRNFWLADWQKMTPQQRVETSQSTLNKVRRFLANPLIRNIVCQKRSTVDFGALMDQGKILLVNLSKGRLGEDNSGFLGSIIVAKLLVAALGRASQTPGERRPFHIIVDEFQTFAVSSFPTLLSEARKYNIDLVIAHQYRAQLDQLSRGATTNAGNLICFRCNGTDSVELAREFDYTPPRPEMEMVPLYQQVDGGRNLWSRGDLATERPANPRIYTDVYNEWANRLTQLPNHAAWCRLLQDGEHQFLRLKTQPLGEPRNGWEQRVERVRAIYEERYAGQIPDVPILTEELRQVGSVRSSARRGKRGQAVIEDVYTYDPNRL